MKRDSTNSTIYQPEYTYTLKLEKEGVDLNGVTTLDMLFILRDINTTRPFTSNLSDTCRRC